MQAAAAAVDAGAIAAAQAGAGNPAHIGVAVHEARLAAMTAMLDVVGRATTIHSPAGNGKA